MADVDGVAELKEKVALSCRILAMLGLVKETTGHVSARIPGADRMLIRARGMDETGLLFTSESEVLETDFNGSDVSNDATLGKPQELPIHGESYKARRDAMCVVHAHPPAVLLCGITGVELRPIFGAYDPSCMKLALDGIPIYNRAITLTTPALVKPMLDLMGEKGTVCVLRGHGITVFGQSVEEATVRAIKLEALARICWQTSQRGSVPDIAVEDTKIFGSSPSSQARSSSLPVWRYYVSLVEGRGSLLGDGIFL